MRLRKRQNVETTDFRNISKRVHENRKERARHTETLRENPEEAEAAVRTYQPEERLRSVDRETQQLVEDARDIPRNWDCDAPLFAIRPPDPITLRKNFLVVLGVNVLLSAITLGALRTIHIDDILLFPTVAAASIVILAIASFVYMRELGALAWIGLVICLVEIADFVVVIGRQQ
jgi:hypothetical protein